MVSTLTVHCAWLRDVAFARLGLGRSIAPPPQEMTLAIKKGYVLRRL